MRLASFRRNGEESYGAVSDKGIVDLKRRLPYPTLLDFVRGNGLDEAWTPAAEAPDFPLGEVELLPPVIGEKIICIGINYAERNEEYKDDQAAPRYPSVFLRVPDSFVGSGQNLVRPKVSDQFDYEGEIVLVIGRGGRHIPPQAALDHIAGMTIGNEGTVRDWVRHGKFNVTQGKNFDGSGSLGPWMVTPDELSPTSTLHLTTKVNGELRQDETTERMIFKFDYLIAYLSSFMTLKAGDIILTGTPVGAGARFDPPKWLKPGDRLEITVDGLGTLSNGVIDEV